MNKEQLQCYNKHIDKLLYNAMNLELVLLCKELIHLQIIKGINIKLVWDNELERAIIIGDNKPIYKFDSFTLSDYDNIRHLMFNTTMDFCINTNLDFDTT